MYGRMPGVSYPDYRHARLIVVWGANPSTSGIHLVPHIRAAMDAGAALVVIDPRRTNLVKRADIHLQVRPGPDVAVAMSIHRFLFENGFEDEEFLTTHTRGAISSERTSPTGPSTESQRLPMSTRGSSNRWRRCTRRYRQP